VADLQAVQLSSVLSMRLRVKKNPPASIPQKWKLQNLTGQSLQKRSEHFHYFIPCHAQQICLRCSIDAIEI